MFDRFTVRARQTVVLGQEEARALGHGHIGTEHLLLGLTREAGGGAAQVLEAFDVRTERVRAAVAAVVPRGAEPSVGQIPFTPRAKRMLELALHEALSHGDRQVDTEHVLLGMLRGRDCTGTRLLERELGVDPDGLRDAVIARLPVPPDSRAREVLARRQIRMAVPEELLGPLSGAVNGLVREIERAGKRSADPGDLLLMLAAMPGSTAARALAALGIGLDDLQAAIESARSEADAAPPAPAPTDTPPTETTAGALREIRRRLGLSEAA